MDPMALLLIVTLIALVCEVIDSSIGMGYGTLLSPIMILLGYNPVEAVPVILLTQAVGGAVASFAHHRNGNVKYSMKSKDAKIVYAVCVCGIVAAVIGSVVLVRVTKAWISGYIGAMVLVMGILVVSGWASKFSWKKIMAIGLVSSFNKGLTGGGFGPIVTGGQIISGNGCKSSVGTTTLAEVPICLAGFISLMVLNGVEKIDISLYLAMTLGVIWAAVIGPIITAKLSVPSIRSVIGFAMIVLGSLAIYKLL